MIHLYLQRIYGPRCKGKVLNVGLGWGYSARVMLSLRGVNQVVTVEKDLPTIAAYQSRFAGDPLESRHNILQSDIGSLGTVLAAVKPFDFIFVDTIEDLTEGPYATLRAFFAQIKTDGILAPNGVLQIEYQADTPIEREFRNQWMETNFRKVQESVLGLREPKLYYQLS